MPISRATLQQTIVPRLATPATTWSELLGLFAGHLEPVRCYVIVAVGPGRYDALALVDLDDYRTAPHEPEANLPLAAVPGLLRPAAAVFASRASWKEARRAMHAQPRRRLVLLDEHGDIAGILTATRLGSAAAPTPSALATHAPYLTATFAGLPPLSPLVVGRAALLTVSVGAPGDGGGHGRSFAFDFGGIEGPMPFAVAVDADPEAWAIIPVEPTLLLAPPGHTLQAASFQITPLRPGRDKLRISIERDGVPLQSLWCPVLATVEGASLVTPAAQHWPEVALPLDAVGVIRPAVEITVQPGDQGSVLVVRADLPHATVRETYRISVSTAAIQDAALRLRQELERLSFYPSPKGDGSLLFANFRSLTVEPLLARQACVELADAGQMVWAMLFQTPRGDARLAHLATELRALPPGSTLRIVIDSQELILPWALLYDHPGPISVDTLTWEGFWGYRYAIEVIPPGRYPAPTIDAQPLLAQMLLTNDDSLSRAVKRHVDRISALFGTDAVIAAWGDGQVQEALREPASITVLYCLCHGAYAGATVSSVRGGRVALAGESALQFSPGRSLRLTDLRRLPAAPLDSRPLVFLNTCEGATQDPFIYDGFMPFFIEQQGARGFISTEVKAPQLLAYDFAQRFLLAFTEGQRIGGILWQLRRYYLERHANIMAFNYSLYGPGDTRIAAPRVAVAPQEAAQ